MAAPATDLVEDLLGVQTMRLPTRARGERRLVLAVLESAVHDLRPTASRAWRHNARRWLYGCAVTNSGFTFARACEVLDVEPSWALRRLMLRRLIPRLRQHRVA